MRRNSSTISLPAFPSLSAKERGISFAAVLIICFLAFLGLLIAGGIVGPMMAINVDMNQSSTQAGQTSVLYSANASLLYSENVSEVPMANDSASITFEEVARVERLIVAYANAERVDYGHTVLVRNPDLANISQYHSYDMGVEGYFDHRSPRGYDPGDRAAAAGYECTDVGENIVTTEYSQRTYAPHRDEITTYQTSRQLAKALVGHWMTSGGHRWAILTPKYDVVGVGVYVRGDDQVYATMMLCDRPGWPDSPPEGMAAPVADPGADYNESYWEPYPDWVDASWAENISTASSPTSTGTGSTN